MHQDFLTYISEGWLILGINADGYRLKQSDGSASRSLNAPQADLGVESIFRCMQDPFLPRVL